MFCKNCGSKLDDDAVFCTSCGAKIADEMPINYCRQCGAKLDADAAFCSACGAKVQKENYSAKESDAVPIEEQMQAAPQPVAESVQKTEDVLQSEPQSTFEPAQNAEQQIKIAEDEQKRKNEFKETVKDIEGLLKDGDIYNEARERLRIYGQTVAVEYLKKVANEAGINSEDVTEDNIYTLLGFN